MAKLENLPPPTAAAKSTTTTADFEIRLLMCSLAGSTDPRKAHVCDQNTEPGTLESAIESVVLNVERGAFADALSSKNVKALLWEPQNSMWVSSAKSPHDFYNSVRLHINSFVECLDGSEGWASSRALLAMAVGVAALLAFWQVNVTGPCVAFPPCQTLVLPSDMQMLNEEDWNAWAKKQLMVDGCDLVGCSLPQYLIFAKLLLVNALEAAKTGQKFGVKLPSTISWWACRALFAHQQILAERSSSLHETLTALKPGIFQVNLGLDIDRESANIIRTAAQLEYGLVEYVYGHIDRARGWFKAAREACGLQLHLTGVLGFRTAHQIDPKAQMVLLANNQSNSKEQAPKAHERPLQNQSKDDDMGTENRSIEDSREEDILMVPKLVGTDILKTNELKEPKGLGSLQQAVILTQCLDIKKSNPDDELRGWQMAPFIEAVDAQEFSHFMVKCCCQLLRIRWECTRSRTKQRALLMLEQLVEDLRESAHCEVQDRMCYAFCVCFPTLSVLLKEYAEMMVSCGLVRDALQIFEQLELWNSLIDCYCLLGKKAAALDLIKKRLEQQPDDPRLWCALGDVTLNEECYVKAWEVSRHRFGRAQRSLGRSAYNKGEYARSMKHWETALALNSLHPDGWFALGSASLKARELDKAVDSFTRAVQLEPENGEAWNNIAAIHMTKRKSKEAFVAFREALKFKRSSWQMFENYARVALDVGNSGQAIEALNMVLELSQGKRVNVDCLTKLMEEVEARFDARESQLAGADSNGGVHINVSLQKGTSEENRDDLEQVALDEALEGASCLSKDSVHEPEQHMTEREWLVTRVGKLLSKAVQTSQDGAIWGLLARWHKVKGDLAMCSEASLKQVRSLQGSDWQHSRDQFQKLCQASLQLCDIYMETSSRTGSKKELYSAQMLLRNIVKQGEPFSSTDDYVAIERCLSDIKHLIQTSE